MRAGRDDLARASDAGGDGGHRIAAALLPRRHPAFWLKMQAMHDRTKARQENGATAGEAHIRSLKVL
jgi:hypothetical protein